MKLDSVDEIYPLDLLTDEAEIPELFNGFHSPDSQTMCFCEVLEDWLM